MSEIPGWQTDLQARKHRPQCKWWYLRGWNCNNLIRCHWRSLRYARGHREGAASPPVCWTPLWRRNYPDLAPYSSRRTGGAL